MGKYEVIIWWDKDEETFLAEVPELPGCMADGDTLEEVAKAAEIAINAWIEFNTERGFAIPEPKGRLAIA